MVADHPAVARVRAALAASGAPGEVVVLDGQARTAAEAAEGLGVGVAQIVKSLVFAVPPPAGQDPGVVLVLAAGHHRVDTGRVATTLGVAAVERAHPDLVRRHTGFPIGGVAPVGHPVPIATLVDVALADHEQVWASAGHPRAVFRTSYPELVRITGGAPATVGSDPA